MNKHIDVTDQSTETEVPVTDMGFYKPAADDWRELLHDEPKTISPLAWVVTGVFACLAVAVILMIWG